MAKELWDAYDRDGNCLGFELVRGEPLPEGETVDYRLLPYEDYKRFILTQAFTEGIRDRFLAYEEAFDRIIGEQIDLMKSKRDDHGDYT